VFAVPLTEIITPDGGRPIMVGTLDGPNAGFVRAERVLRTAAGLPFVEVLWAEAEWEVEDDDDVGEVVEVVAA
jgi:hypothetical protein